MKSLIQGEIMFKWVAQYRGAKPQTKYFILNWFVYGLVIILTTVYCYARLDYVRSDHRPPTEDTKK